MQKDQKGQPHILDISWHFLTCSPTLCSTESFWPGSLHTSTASTSSGEVTATATDIRTANGKAGAICWINKDWEITGKFTGKPHISWENRWFPVEIFPGKPIHWLEDFLDLNLHHLAVCKCLQHLVPGREPEDRCCKLMTQAKGFSQQNVVQKFGPFRSFS